MFDFSNAFNFDEIFANFLDFWYAYALLLVFLVSFILFVVFRKKVKRHNLTQTQSITYISVLTALCAVVNVLTQYPATYIAISFVPTMCFIAGYMLGAKAGFIIGFMGDLIAAIVFPAGPYNPFIGIANGLMGFIPGFIFDNFKGNIYIKIVISTVLTLFICTIGLNTFGLWLIYGYGKKSFWAYLWVRLPWQALVAAGNCVLCVSITSILRKVLPKHKFFLDNEIIEDKINDN